MSHFKFLLAASTLLLASACDAPEDPFDREAEPLAVELDEDGGSLAAAQPLLEDGEERFGEGVTVLDRVALAGGTELTFVHLDIEGEASLGVIEQQPAGAPSLADVGMDDASVLDLYLAITGPETEIPAPLLELAANNELGERGWLEQRIARGDFDLVAEPDVVMAACDAGFQSWLTNWNSQVTDGQRWGLNEDPDSDADWYGPTEPLGTGIACTNCSETWWHRDYYNDQFELFNVDEMKMGVDACNIGYRPPLTAGNTTLSHYGPTLRFRYRTENNASSGEVWSRDLTAAEEGTHWRWYWLGSSTSGFNDYDWTIEIANARAADRYDLGFMWNHHGW